LFSTSICSNEADAFGIGDFIVVIYAAAKFSCRHRYIVTIEHERPLFVCERCHHRTELLCLDRRTPLNRVVTFAPSDFDREPATEQYSA
jgi:hypothetical protein